ncbi:MAG TPA: hydroxyquinol 1,2-dioxygenase [Gammaproteobacteria bacterium]|nr:hydroxyquinol 1,2-dioxygenase [Gammaproteobacteria bacterium]
MPHVSACGPRAGTLRRGAGYRTFELGEFTFSRDECSACISWTAQGRRLSHTMPADAFLRALMRDVAWGFFYGSVYFDDVFGTRNRYGRVEFQAGLHDPAYRERGLHRTSVIDTDLAMETCMAILRDWTNAGFDPFAAPRETSAAWMGRKAGQNDRAVGRRRAVCRRIPGLAGDVTLRKDPDYPVNAAFHDVPQDEPEIRAEPGFEHEVHAFNLFAYLSRSDVTWNPSVASVCGHSLFCPTTEEHLMPVKHANDRIEWFLQLSDSIQWTIEDQRTGRPRVKLIMQPGDVAAMPVDIQHRGFAPKRSMLLVWENADPRLPRLHESGRLPASPAHEFLS